MEPISVVIPALNEEANIGDCLDRLLPQLGSQDEIIVVDNGSTDGTATIAESFDDVRVVSAPDEAFTGDGHVRGLAQVRQFGAEHARNPIVATTDADTRPPSDWLDRIRAHFENDPETTVLWGVVTDTNGVPVRNLTGKYLTFLGGVSGSNTAFRKSAFDRLDDGYIGWPMFEDVALIARLSRTGKAVHDTDLRMRSDLDRTRYQTYPMLAGAGVMTACGAVIGGPFGAVAAGTGIGLAGTELLYESAPKTRFHHDQLGLLLMLGGVAMGGPLGLALAGTGTGLLGHHILTEGTSAIPTPLMQNTDEVCRIPTGADVGAGEIAAALECEPANDQTMKTTRVLAAATAGGIVGKALIGALA